jgi:hypothetical protein
VEDAAAEREEALLPGRQRSLPVYAQEGWLEVSARARDLKALYLKTLYLTLLGRYLDAATTYLCLMNPLVWEANPFMAPLLSNPPLLFVVQTLGGLLVWAILVVAGARSRSPRCRKLLPWIAVALSYPPVVNNLLVLMGYPDILGFLYGVPYG